MDLKIVTNNVPRDIIDAAYLTAAERAEFDYLDWTAIDAGTDSASFFRYRGTLHDLGEFMRWTTCPDALKSWDGYASDNAFSATVVKYANDFESVIVGRVYS